MQSKKEVNYRSAEGDKACATCVHFDQVSKCALVDGTVAPSGLCDLYTESSQNRGMPAEARPGLEDMLLGGMMGGNPNG